ncbi:MAG: putative endonuclease [Paracoccaceae bacterium]|jgi:putative endonuclease
MDAHVYVLERRIAEHNAGKYGGFTSYRLPVKLVYAESFGRITDAIAAERQIKGWGRAKKEALIRGDFGELKTLASRSLSAKNRSTRAQRLFSVSGR